MESALLDQYPFRFCSSRCRARAPISTTQCFKRSNFSLHCKFQHPLTLKFDIHLGKPASFHLYFRSGLLSLPSFALIFFCLFLLCYKQTRFPFHFSSIQILSSHFSVEKIAQVRGDIARSLMYMGVRYGIQRPSDNLHLQLSDSPSIEKREMGLLSSMLKWNEMDPPSREEKLRNNRICKMYQHNRNPFIDHPEYANLIWRDVGLRSPTVYGSSSLKAWINEFHYKNKGKDENEFVEIIVRASDATQLKLVLYNGANGKMYKSLPLTNKSVFTVSDSSLGFAIYTAFMPLQNGPSDGMALVSGIDGRVIQFLSYEGTLQAVDGPAKGAKSTDVKVGENEVSSKFDSLGLTGEQIEKFEWKKFVGGASPGKPNRGQRISDS